MKYLFIMAFISLLLNADDSLYKNADCETSFKNIVEQSLKEHPNISMSNQLVKGAEYQLDTAFWGYFPTPSVDVSVVDKDQKQITARLDQPLWTGGKIDASYDKALSQQQEALQTLDENRYKLIENNINTLKDYLHSRKKIKVLRENKKQFEELSLVLKRMMEAEVLSKADQNLLASRLASVSSDLIVAKSKLEVAEMQFEILSGIKIECSVAAKEINIFSDETDLENLIDNLRKKHPSLKKIDAKVKNAVSLVKESESKLWPSLVLRLEHREGTIYKEIEKPQDTNMAYIALNASPGAGLSAFSNVEKSKMDVLKIKYEKSTTEKELIDKLMKDYISLVTAISHVSVVQNDIIISQDVYDSNVRLFFSQKKSWLDLVNSLSELNKEKMKHAQLVVDQHIYQYKIALMAGFINLEKFEVLDDI